MYKKITHNIVEEHYEHPAVVPENTKIKAGSVFLNTQPENSTSAVTLRMASKDYFVWYLWNLRNYVTARIAVTEEINLYRNSTVSHARSLIDVVKNYYGAPIGPNAVMAFETLTVSLLDLVEVLANNQDSKPAVERAKSSVTNFANSVNALAPVIWPSAAVSEIWTAVVDSIFDQTTARMEKQWDKDQAAVKSSYGILVSGQGTGVQGFAEVFALGIIQQQPSRFLQ